MTISSCWRTYLFPGYSLSPSEGRNSGHDDTDFLYFASTGHIAIPGTFGHRKADNYDGLEASIQNLGNKFTGR